ncbi:hypothetical protein FRZ44_47320 [Hypericibacter terrae]|uniref:Uncharacterized protein n=1 Tax=Hypericibacter terrae TaxID=2602015 RepID=A0A5J6MPZ9_9PROT|nr:hypothetical protein FRZ44_47320 [Hypericibacter terrae]
MPAPSHPDGTVDRAIPLPALPQKLGEGIQAAYAIALPARECQRSFEEISVAAVSGIRARMKSRNTSRSEVMSSL